MLRQLLNALSRRYGLRARRHSMAAQMSRLGFRVVTRDGFKYIEPRGRA